LTSFATVVLLLEKGTDGHLSPGVARVPRPYARRSGVIVVLDRLEDKPVQEGCISTRRVGAWLDRLNSPLYTSPYLDAVSPEESTRCLQSHLIRPPW
jgi:hypothetical protein